jgi:alkanesulfonate monooxygenase SsuD/methylene tetrahydromethanopterin reductase-like flavin-dependent oxidoreductase (luciferase family)
VLELGAHLPLIDVGDGTRTLGQLRAYARRASELGYSYLCANDHLFFVRPWLDGPAALAATLEDSGGMRLATTVCLPVVRGPAPTAKTLGSLDLLSGGRLVAGVGPGSSARDYEAVGIPFEERWGRFEEAIPCLRALLAGERFAGRFYAAGDAMEPRPAQRPAPPIWVGSWGSTAGLRRVARHADGWLASGYNTTPERFRGGRALLGECLLAEGRDPAGFPNGLATVWLYVTESRARSERVLAGVLAPMLNRPAETLRQLSLPIGGAEECAERLAAFADAGVERVFVWPLGDELEQLALLSERVVPLLAGA